MNKNEFAEYLRHCGYGADIEYGIPTVFVTESEEVKRVWKEVKLLSNKVGYNHSFSVKKLEVQE